MTNPFMVDDPRAALVDALLAMEDPALHARGLALAADVLAKPDDAAEAFTVYEDVHDPSLRDAVRARCAQALRFAASEVVETRPREGPVLQDETTSDYCRERGYARWVGRVWTTHLVAALWSTLRAERRRA